MEYWPDGSEKPASASFGNVMHSGVAQYWNSRFGIRDRCDPYAAMHDEYERLGASFETETVNTLELAGGLVEY